MLEPAMLAPVLSQPSLPMFPASGLHIGTEELGAVKQRLVDDDLTVLAYRFENDKFCRAERFAAYREALGDRFVGDETLKNSDANPAAHMKNPHSVLTEHLIDEDGSKTTSETRRSPGVSQDAAAVGDLRDRTRATGYLL